MNKHLLIISIFFVSSILAGLLSAPGNKAYLVACDVGQGDAILLIRGTTQVLIDGGPSNKVLECLADNMPFWDRRIEMVLNTHPEKDHIYGLLSVIEQYQVDQLISSSYWHDTALFKRFVQEVRAKNIPVYSPQAGDELQVNGFQFRVLWPEELVGDSSIWQKDLHLARAKEQAQVLGEQSIEPNEQSIVSLLKYKGRKILLTGDISISTEDKILNRDGSLLENLDILKVAHHGSKYSTGEKMLNTTKPKLAVISVGKNPWGHPTEEVLSRLTQVKAKIRRTDHDRIKIQLD